MKISNDLPTFESKNVMVVVISPSLLEIYKVENGVIDKAEEHKIEKAEFSDKKGYFTNGGGWKVAASSGSQLVKRDLMQRAEKEFANKLKIYANSNKTDEIYIFSPDYFITQVDKILPKTIFKKVKMIFKGNYHKSHPFDLLKKIGKDSKVKNMKVKVENIPDIKAGNKIIKNSRQAKKVIRDPK